MKRSDIYGAVVLAALAAFAFVSPTIAVELTGTERSALLAHAPWPSSIVELQHSDGSKEIDERWAATLGQTLFFETRLSSDNTFSCASCHVPARWFSDGVPVAVGRVPLVRNTPTVVDAKFARWLGWGGEFDSVWSQTLRALTAPKEMNASHAHISALARNNGDYSCALERAFSVRVDTMADEDLAVLVAKSLAAFQATLISGRSPFDEFLAGLRAGDSAAMAGYPADALAGAKLFVGRGRCNVCHFGPRFTHEEFAEIGIGYFTSTGVDKGRYAGIDHLKANRYNLLGPFSDGPTSGRANLTRRVVKSPRNFGEFRVPSLRNVERTAPYMHNGSLATLEDVVSHYSELNVERLHATSNGLLQPLKLSATESKQLVEFLRSLTSELMSSPALPSIAQCRAQ